MLSVSTRSDFLTTSARPSRAFGLVAALLLLPGVLAAAEPKIADAATNISIADDGIPGAGPMNSDPEFQRASSELRAVWPGRIQTDRNAVVFFGDANIQRWGTGLEAAFPGVKVANRGIAGDTTRSALLRLQQDVIVLDPKAVVLLLGSSDLAHGITPEIAATNLRLILAALEKARPAMPIVLCQVLPRSDTSALSPDKIKALNAAFLDVVRNRPAVTFVETWAQFADANGGGSARDFSDQVHLTEAGYEKLAAGLRPIFSTLGILTETPARGTPEPGFVSLFNERDLTGWGFRPTPPAEIEAGKRRDASNPRPPVRFYSEKPVQFDGATVTPDGRYLARNGRLVVTTPPEYRKIQQLWTTQEFAQDFILKFEFRATPNADSGVYIRGPQLQVRDYLVAGPYNKLSRYRPQDWNEIEIRVTGTEAVCTCNGEVIETGFKVPATGPIGFEGDRGQVEYRHIQIKTL